MYINKKSELHDDGERIIPTEEGEVSFVFSRHKFAYQYAQDFVKGKTVIDIGCGTGYGSKILAEQAKLVHGIDYHPEAITYCKTHYNAPNIHFFQQDATKLNGDQEFDVAVCFQAIEHFEQIDDFLQRVKRLVKINGKILISTPNVKNSKKLRENPFHVNEMNYTQFNNILQKHFESFELLGVGYASKNKLRKFLGKMPFYQWGKILKRQSKIKKFAGRTLNMTNFKILNTNVANEAADLLAVCNNH